MALPSATLSNILRAAFRNSSIYSYIARSYNSRGRYIPASIWNSQLYDKALVVNASSARDFFVPTFSIPKIIQNLNNELEHHVPEFDISYMMPLVISRQDNKVTASAIINSALSHNGNLIRIVSKETLYYGGRGIILDENYTPLIVWGYMMSFSAALNGIFVTRPVVYVNSSVFTNTDGVSKYIAKAILPTLATNNATLPTIHGLCDATPTRICMDSNLTNTPEIIIRDLSAWIYRVPTPRTDKYSGELQDQLIELLNDN